MNDLDVASVRRFSRSVTSRVGALDDSFLARDRPLGQSRVLWEIGPDGVEVGVLRARLALDPAQVSRTLRTLEGEGFVRVHPHPDDARVRVASLTPAGRTEWRELERRSDDAARDILRPLSAAQRQRLVTAMGEVERLLGVSVIEIAERSPSDPAARACLRSYVAELEQRFGVDFDPNGNDEKLVRPDGVLLLASLRDAPVGCGAVKFAPGEPPEIKRLWTAPVTRGTGLGRRLLGELEAIARASGADRVRLDTNGTLTEAIALYRSAGYVEIGRYNDNPHAEHFFEKAL